MIALEFIPQGNTLLGKATIQTKSGPIVLNASADRFTAHSQCLKLFSNDPQVCEFLNRDMWNPARVMIGQQLKAKIGQQSFVLTPPIILANDAQKAYDYALWIVQNARLFDPKALTTIEALFAQAQAGSLPATKFLALLDLVEAYVVYMATVQPVDLKNSPFGVSGAEVGSCCKSCESGGSCETSCKCEVEHYHVNDPTCFPPNAAFHGIGQYQGGPHYHEGSKTCHNGKAMTSTQAGIAAGICNAPHYHVNDPTFRSAGG